jgi:cytoskeletal protein CcmA (bactofilin family)
MLIALRSLVVIALTILSAQLFAPLLAAEFRGDEQLVIKKEETIKDDLYVFGKFVTIDGAVEGDVIAFGEQITINGTVTGDIMAAGRVVVLGGSAEDARIAGEVLKLTPTAKLSGDLVAAGMSLECEPASGIEGDVLFAGYQGLFAGQVGQDLTAKLVHCRLAGRVGGRAELHVTGTKGDPPASQFSQAPVALPMLPTGLSLSDTAILEGQLDYSAPQEAQIDEGARIVGKLEYHMPEPPPQQQAAADGRNPTLNLVVDRARHAASVAIVGLLAVLLFPKWTGAWADNVRTRPAASLGAGVAGSVAIVGILILAIVLIVAAAVLSGWAALWDLLALVIVGGIVSYLALVVFTWLLAAFLAEVIVGLAVGRLALAGDGLPVRVGAMLLGLVAVVLVLSVPYLGPISGLAMFLFALGGFCLWLIGATPALTEPAPVAK